MKIRTGNVNDEQVVTLLRNHLAMMHENSPPENVFALDLPGLEVPNVTFYTAWDDMALTGMGALKEINARQGEVKSMKTHEAHLRKGVAASLLKHIIKEARSRKYERLSLETGSSPAFEPAISLYLRHGFKIGEAFGQYEKSGFSQFLHLDLDRIAD